VERRTVTLTDPTAWKICLLGATPGARPVWSVRQADAVQPAEVEIGLPVVREVERQSAEVDRQWKLRLDRVRYEAHLKNLLRMLIREVSLSPVDVPSKLTRVRVLWQTGSVTDLTIERLGRAPVWGRSSVEVEKLIADEVKRRSLLHPRRWHWGAHSVMVLRWRLGLRRTARMPSPERRADGLLSLRGVATRLGVSARAVRYWIEQGLLAPLEAAVAKAMVDTWTRSWFGRPDDGGPRGNPHANRETRTGAGGVKCTGSCQHHQNYLSLRAQSPFRRAACFPGGAALVCWQPVSCSWPWSRRSAPCSRRAGLRR
jgi:hypothetical protein